MGLMTTCHKNMDSQTMLVKVHPRRYETERELAVRQGSKGYYTPTQVKCGSANSFPTSLLGLLLLGVMLD